jgi:hypothetical protein
VARRRDVAVLARNIRAHNTNTREHPMATVVSSRSDPYGSVAVTTSDTASHKSGVSWAAILAGAAASAALSLILLVLGTGLGFASVSPWAQRGVSAGAFTLATAIWISATAVIASGIGGYIAGRLRVKWASMHTDEVYFRDTAHGFLAWAVATLATAAVLGSAIGGIVSAGASAAGTVATAGAAVGAAAVPGAMGMAGGPGAERWPMGGNAYFVDSLFRRDPSAPQPAAAAAPMGDAGDERGGAAPEVSRIFANALRGGALPQEDARYVGQLVAQRTGLSQTDAEKRVTDTYARAQARVREVETAAKDAANEARKAAAWTSLWIFVSLLIGAFSASLAATFGGRRRDLQSPI